MTDERPACTGCARVRVTRCTLSTFSAANFPITYRYQVLFFLNFVRATWGREVLRSVGDQGLIFSRASVSL